MFPSYDEWRKDQSFARTVSGRLRFYSLKNLAEEIEAYDKTVLDHARRIYTANDEPLNVLAQYGTWAVTDYGLECLQDYYCLSREQLFDAHLDIHMAAKNWVNMYDFLRALRAGRALYTAYKPGYCKSPIPAPMRWKVWKRDSFTCRLCGAQENLSVDHITPERCGGVTQEDNLQTLCKSCNSRKGARV